MVSSVTSATTSTTSSSSTSTSTSALSNYDTFISLLCAQLQYQDPLDPADTSEFTSQLVQYANLEQQMSTNDKLDEVINSLSSLSLSNGTGYLGRTVEAEGDEISVEDDGTVDAGWVYELDDTAASVTLTVTDSDGNVVWSGEGETASGRHSFEWDGTDSDGNTVAGGAYTLTVSATDSSGDTVDSTTYVSGTVTAVSSLDDTAVVEMGDMAIALTAITRLAA